MMHLRGSQILHENLKMESVVTTWVSELKRDACSGIQVSIEIGSVVVKPSVSSINDLFNKILLSLLMLKPRLD